MPQRLYQQTKYENTSKNNHIQFEKGKRPCYVHYEDFCSDSSARVWAREK